MPNAAMSMSGCSTATLRRCHPPRRRCCFIPASAGWLPAQTGELENPPICRPAWDAAHPAAGKHFTARISSSSARVHEDGGAPKDGGDAVLVSARGRHAAVVAHERGSRRVSFAFCAGRFQFRAARRLFRIFLGNALNWMVGEPALLTRRPRVWSRCRLPTRVLVAADGTELADAMPSPAAACSKSGEPGLFTAVSAQQRLRVAANLLDRAHHRDQQVAAFDPMVRPGADAPVRSPAARLRSIPGVLLLAAALPARVRMVELEPADDGMSLPHRIATAPGRLLFLADSPAVVVERAHPNQPRPAGICTSPRAAQPGDCHAGVGVDAAAMERGARATYRWSMRWTFRAACPPLSSTRR